MVEILAERALLHQLVEVAVGGHDHAHVHGDGAVAADALHLPLFQDAQQLGLHHQRHVADFVQEQRAAVGLFEFAQVPGGGAGERALLMAEQLGFDQLAGHGRAVQGDERAVAARAALVQGARDQFLARCRFRPGCRRALRWRPRGPPAP